MEMEKKRCSDEEDLLLLLLHKQGGCCLIQEILVWLPVVSLLRFKSVCKSWRDLIQSPFFIDLYTTFNSSSSSSSKFGSFIVHVSSYFPPPNSSSNYRQSEKNSLLMLSSQSDDDSESESGGGGGGGSNDQKEEGLVVVVVDNLGFEMHNKEIVGSCNGLVCIHNRQLTSSNESKPDVVSLFNPATGKVWDLPEPIPIPDGVYSLVVFGFDVETKDYKVVRFTRLKKRWNGNGPMYCFCQVQLYSLSTDSWRPLKGIPCLPGYPFLYTQSVVYLNNNPTTTSTCFFLAHFFYTELHPCLAENNRFIISFDFTKEILTPIPLPDHHRYQELCLCSLGHDQLALFTSPTPQDGTLIEDFDVWVLNNYEQGSSSSSVNKKSWEKLHSFRLQLDSPDEWYTPIGISNDGKFAILTSEYGYKMNLYNFATKEVERDFLSCRTVMSKAHAYKPSLVSVIGGNGAGSSSSSGSRYGD